MAIRWAARETTVLRAGGPFGQILELLNWHSISRLPLTKLGDSSAASILNVSSSSKWPTKDTTVVDLARVRAFTFAHQAVTFLRRSTPATQIVYSA